MRSNRWIPIPGESDSSACDAIAGALVPCWPPAAPVWFDVSHEIAAGSWADQTTAAIEPLCLINTTPKCPLAEPAQGDCLDLWVVASDLQEINRFLYAIACADVALNGASMWEPTDYANTGTTLEWAYPLTGGDQISGVVEVGA